MSYKLADVIWNDDGTMANEKITPLQALQDLSKLVFIYGGMEQYKIIETALKDYELLKERTKLDSFECLLRLEEILPRGKELLVPVAKQLKALEIIKEKRVDVDEFMESTSCAGYNVGRRCNELTQEEYDLLKEVLL